MTTADAKPMKNDTPAEEAAAKDKAPAGGLALWPLCLTVVVFFFVLDHATKWWAVEALKPEGWISGELQTYEVWKSRPIIVLIPGLLQFAYAENLGAAFSILWGNVFLLGLISVAASIALVFYWRTLPAAEKWGRVAVALVLSGALGNMVDRLYKGYVVDFIDAYITLGGVERHWPTFNIADSCICVGAAILAVRFIQGKI